MIANSMTKEAEKELTKMNKKLNNIFTLVKLMKINQKDLEGGRCMTGRDGKLGFSKNKRK